MIYQNFEDTAKVLIRRQFIMGFTQEIRKI